MRRIVNRVLSSGVPLSLRRRVGVSGGWFLIVSWASVAGLSAPGADWPMVRGGPALLGVVAGKLESPLRLLWSFQTRGPVKSSAAVVDGRVFIGSDDQTLYALDLARGEKVWSFKTEGPIESSPLVLNGRVYFGSSDAWVYALEAPSGK